MSKIIEKEKNAWVHPWQIEKFDNIANRDERFFSLAIKGALSWLTRNIILYNKPIKHFILNTGSSYMYVESNGYEFNFKETSGEDQIYMSRPRCVVEFDNLTVDTEELSQPHLRGTYERYTKNGNVAGFNAEFRRMPITISMNLTYVLSNFNEGLVLMQELVEKMLFQKYYKIVYLGQTIECSLEFPNNFKVEMNKIDMTSVEQNNKTISVQLNICTNYPVFDEQTEISNSNVIAAFTSNTDLYYDEPDNVTDEDIRKVD